MSRSAIILLLVASLSHVYGQKIRGVYVGEIFSRGNALVLQGNREEITGFVYLSKTERLNFAGNYVDHHFKGLVRSAGGGIVSLSGTLKNTQLVLSRDSAGVTRTTKLYKVSSNPDDNMEELFSEQNDRMLLGLWETINVKMEGVPPFDGKFTWAFEPNGKLYQRNLMAPSEKGNFNPPPGFDLHKPVELGWATAQGELTIIYPRVTSNSQRYVVRGDTLIVFLSNGMPGGFYLRK